jgi:hypothetical protein
VLPVADPRIVVGGYHIHTTRSDGSGTVDDVAQAAARAHLAFVILTDHGNATRTPDPPMYRHGVLVIDAVEVSTSGGHIVALDLSAPAPYPLGGEPRDVLEDIHRLGGIAIVAHPDSPSDGLRYTGPDSGFDGIEWLNMDSVWRGASTWQLLTAAARYGIRPPGALARLADRPEHTLRRWDTAAARGTVFGMAALDAHARIGWRTTPDPRPRTSPSVNGPSYEAMFRTLGQAVVLDAPLSGDASSDASRVLAAIAHGHSFSAVRAIADPAAFDFTACQGDACAGMGDRLTNAGVSTTFEAVVPHAPQVRVVLLRDGREVASGSGRLTWRDDRARGVYRVEVAWPGWRVPWLVSNAITIGAPPTIAADVDRIVDVVATPLSRNPGAWNVERDPASSASIRTDRQALQLEFHLADGGPTGQYVALASGPVAGAHLRGVRLTVSADRPMRLSLQLRTAGGRRWRRSVYVDRASRAIDVPIGEFLPVDRDAGALDAGDVTTLLLVVDTINTSPGASGVVRIADIDLAQPPKAGTPLINRDREAHRRAGRIAVSSHE